MARINLRQQKLSFRNQPIGLIQRSNAVEQSLASTANEVNKLNKIVFDELAQQAKETGEERLGTQAEYDAKTKSDWQASKKTASQRGWGQVIAKGLAAGMRTLPGGYDAYNPPGDIDITKQMEGLDDKQRMALLKNILGEDFDLTTLNPK